MQDSYVRMMAPHAKQGSSTPKDDCKLQNYADNTTLSIAHHAFTQRSSTAGLKAVLYDTKPSGPDAMHNSPQYYLLYKRQPECKAAQQTSVKSSARQT
jgi:hypothetical protein